MIDDRDILALLDEERIYDSPTLRQAAYQEITNLRNQLDDEKRRRVWTGNLLHHLQNQNKSILEELRLAIAAYYKDHKDD